MIATLDVDNGQSLRELIRELRQLADCNNVVVLTADGAALVVLVPEHIVRTAVIGALRADMTKWYPGLEQSKETERTKSDTGTSSRDKPQDLGQDSGHPDALRGDEGSQSG